MSLRMRVVESRPFAENSYIVWIEDEAVVVDPGFEPDAILAVLAAERLTLAAILNTHGHLDHIAGNETLKKRFPQAPLIIGVGDAPMLTDANLNLGALYGMPLVSPPADRTVTGGDSITYSGLTFEVRDVPGHSPGHVAFLLQSDDQTHVFGGDVLFRDGVGRTDMPGCSSQRLWKSIRSQFWPLADDARVYPGHGPSTTIGYERRANTFMLMMDRELLDA